MTARIVEFSEEWEGRTIDGSFQLRQFLGSAENSAVYLTRFDSRDAAIKLLHVEQGKADAQISRWRAAAKLSHLNLIRIFTMGRCELNGIPLLYVVMEYAEETLSRVLPDRALTATETREMLEPALNALDYIHRQGFVHAHLKPANIVAVDDRLKLSSDGLCRLGANDGSAPDSYDPPERTAGVISPAGDVWRLGMTIVEVLTQRLPARSKEIELPPDLPEPFAEIATHCLKVKPPERWSVPQISERLSQRDGGSLSTNKKRRIAPWGVLIILGLVVLLVVGVVVKRSEPNTPPPVLPGEVAKAPAPEAPPKPERPREVAPKSKAEPKTAPAAPPPPEPIAVETPANGDQPMPEIHAQARRSIHGKVTINVKVDIDPSGAVTDAKLDSPGASKYFSERALKAVRQWKFQPATVDGHQVAQQWRVHFEFLSSGTKVQSKRLSP